MPRKRANCMRWSLLAGECFGGCLDANQSKKWTFDTNFFYNMVQWRILQPMG